MERERFEQVVMQVIEHLPEEFRQTMENVDIMVEDYPTSYQLRKSKLGRRNILLGLYEGVPRTRRTSSYGLVPPDKITIFQKPIEAICRNEAEIIASIESVVKHEIAHHFGISDERLHEMGR